MSVMKTKHIKTLLSVIVLLLFVNPSVNVTAAETDSQVHVWQMKEITLKAEQNYDNIYTDVTCWVDLQCPGLSKRIYGFWDGDNLFRVRIVAAAQGPWRWKSGSNQPDDKGLNNKSGQFTAVDWTDEQKQQNPNRRGFVRSSPNGHAL